MRLLSFVAALAAVTACAAHSPEDKPVPADASTAAPAAPAPASIAKPTLGAFGVDLSAGNPAVKPGDDFFAYANGRWYDAFAIPAGSMQEEKHVLDGKPGQRIAGRALEKRRVLRVACGNLLNKPKPARAFSRLGRRNRRDLG